MKKAQSWALFSFIVFGLCFSGGCSSEIEFSDLDPRMIRAYLEKNNLTRSAESIDEKSRVYIKDGHFFNKDGERIKFYGTNISYGAAFPPKSLAPMIAKQLKNLGFNIVRLHHIDANPVPKGVWKDERCLEFDKEQMDRFDYFVFSLKKEGIYVLLSGHVSRVYAPLRGFDLNGLFKFGKGLVYFSGELADDQLAYAKKILSHYNRYTNKRYVNDPVVALFELSNEDSLVDFAFSQWSKAPDKYTSELKTLWIDFLVSQKNLASQMVSFPTFSSSREEKLLWVNFLLGLEIKHALKYKKAIREIGFQGPILASQANFGGGVGLKRESVVSDIIDIHQYFDPPIFIGKGATKKWHMMNRSLISLQGVEMFSRMSDFRIDGKPFIVSEYDHPAPSSYSSDYIIMLAILAGRQDWDGIFHFDYASRIEDYRSNGTTRTFNMSGNIGKLISTMAASFLYKDELVDKASNVIYLNLSDYDLLSGFIEGNKRWLAVDKKAEISDACNIFSAMKKTKIINNKTSDSVDGNVFCDSVGQHVQVGESSGAFYFSYPKAFGIIKNNGDEQYFDMGKYFIKTNNDDGYAVIVVLSVDGSNIIGSNELYMFFLGGVGDYDAGSIYKKSPYEFYAESVDWAKKIRLKKVNAEVGIKRSANGFSMKCTDAITGRVIDVKTDMSFFKIDNQGAELLKCQTNF